MRSKGGGRWGKQNRRHLMMRGRYPDQKVEEERGIGVGVPRDEGSIWRVRRDELGLVSSTLLRSGGVGRKSFKRLDGKGWIEGNERGYSGCEVGGVVART